MDVSAWITLATVVAIAIALVSDVARPDLIFLTGLGVLLVTGVITPSEAFAGFASTAVIAIGALFVIAAGIEETGLLRTFDHLLLSDDRSSARRLVQLMMPTALLSAFINNTPIVAMLTQPVQKWASRMGISPSKVLIPLSYAAIVGGMSTLMGTSTNVIVSGLMAEYGYEPLGLFAFSWVGVPAAILVIVFMAFVGVRLLPERSHGPAFAPRALAACLFEVRIRERSPVRGQTIAQSGLRNPGDAYLVHVRRDGHVMTASPELVLAHGDVLGFSGNVSALEDLLRRPGLGPTVTTKKGKSTQTLPLYEAVISDTSNLVGKSLQDVQFDETYGAVVLAVQRKTGQLSGSLGSLILKAGDLLFVEAMAGFEERWHRSNAEFYYVASRGSSKTKQPRSKAYIGLGILLCMIALIGTGAFSLATAAFVAALAMIISGCLTIANARQALDLQVLILIAAALGLGEAVAKTGLANRMASGLLQMTEAGPILVLIALYAFTNVLTELITHKAAAVLMLPVGLSLASGMNLPPEAFALTVAVAATASFMTPVGYQTNLMVMAAGRYRVRDYLRVGIPVSLLVMATTTVVVSQVWL